MIALTRLNGSRLYVNCDLIKFAEASPDTTLTLVTGEKVLVREDCADVLFAAQEHRMATLRGAWPAAADALAGLVSARAATAAAQQNDTL